MTSKVQTSITPLQRLLLEHMEKTGDSLAAIAKRGGLPRQTVQAVLYRPGSSVPQEATMTKLAKGLGVPVALVHEAVAKSLTADGKHNGATLRTLEQDPMLAALMAEATELDDTQRQVLLATAKAMRQVSGGRKPRKAADTRTRG